MNHLILNTIVCKLRNESNESVANSLIVCFHNTPHNSLFSIDDPSSCSENTCLEIFGGSATLYHNDEKSTKNGISSSKCKCQCLSHLKTYREDEGLCVDTIRGKEEKNYFKNLINFFFTSMRLECSLVPFISSSTALDTAEKIPSVFLPLQGQIIYPSKELFFADGKNQHLCV